MRKLSLCVSPMMKKFWMATVTVHSSVFTVLVVALGLLFPSIPLTTALKLNGTTTTTSTTTTASIWPVDVDNYNVTSSPILEDAAPKTTIASFLQPDVPETTFIPQTLSQGDELTTTQDNASSASSLAKRHSSIHVSESSSHDNNASPRFNVKKSSPFSTRESDPHSQLHSPSNRETQPQRNGIGSANTNTAEDEGDQSLSLSSTTEQNDDGNRNTLSSTTDNNDSNDSGGSSTFANSLGNEDDGGSLSLDKDESDSSGDNSGATPRGGGGGGSGVVDGDIIYPPEEGEQVDSDELADATTASLVRPGPTLDPNSFAIQLSTKLNRTSGNRTSNRLGTRGLNSKSQLNAITSSTNASTTTIPTIAKNNTISRLRLNRRHNYTDSVASSDSSTDRANVAKVAKDGGDRSNVTIPDNISDSNTFSTRFDLNGTSFSSRSNLNYAQQLNLHHPQTHQQFHRARPTSPVLNYNSNHNNNLHNRIIKRKKIPLGGRNETGGTGGSSLSSIYGNSILSSTSSSISGEEEVADNVEAPARTTTTAPTSGVRTYSLPTGTGVEDATTESNSLLNASQQEHGSSDVEGEEQQEHEEQGSPPSTSGVGGGDVNISHNLTIPVISSEVVYNNPSSNASSTLPSSSRAILGFGGVDAAAAEDAAAHGKVKRPKPIIIRDHEDALFINNLSENNNAGAAPSENITSQAGNNDTSEETPVSSIGTGEEDTNKPVGSNALPTPPFKVRKIKLNGRRASTSRPLLDYEATASSPLSLPPTLEAAPEESISSTRSGLVKAASGPTDYMQIREIIRPSTSHALQQPPVYSSRRVLKEEFGVTHHSYGEDHDDVDGLEATTEFYSENSTPYPIPLGVRSLPEREESVDNEDLVGSDHGKYAGGSHSRSASGKPGPANANDEDDSKYRDYYSEIRSSAVDHGSGNRGHNLHIKSDSHQHQQGAEIGSISPVTVTVTHTIVETTATYSHAVHTTPIPHNGYNNPYSYRYNHNHDMAKRGNNPNLHPTPALPSSILAASTTPTFASGQGPEVISHSVENAQPSTSRYGVNSLGNETTTHSGEDNASDKSTNGQHEHKDEMTPVMPQPVEPTPAISTKDMKSVYFTQVEQPHYTSSSYEFTSSTMYSYMYPDHDHLHHHDDDNDEPHHPDGHEGEEQQSSSPQPELEHNPEVSDKSSTIVSDDQYLTPTPTTAPFWDDLGNLTKSSSSQFPVSLDKENGGLSTPTIDVDIYTPQPGVYPNSKVEQAATTGMPVTTGSSSTTVKNGNAGHQVPGSMEDNEISEEELRKQQGRTTIKPPSDKDKTKIDDNAKVPQGDGIHDHDSGKGSTSTTTMINNVSSTSRDDDGTKTPFGIGDSFGIGTVHVPIMVQMVLDVAQPVFCKHLTGFKEMIVTVYERQKNIHVDPEQIIIYTEPSCSSKKNGHIEDHQFTTAVAEALTGTISPTSKGTYPLTSPPTPPTTPRDGGHHDEDRKKLEPQKDSDSGSKNVTNLSAQSAALTNLNKNQSELSNNKLNSSSSAQGDSAQAHQQKSLIRSRRSTKLGAGAAATTKNSNMSGGDDVKSLGGVNSTMSSASKNSTEFSVFFYVNNKSGDYDQDLTSAFARLWNESSSLLTNNSHSGSGNHGGGDNHVGGGGQHESSDNNYTNEEFIKKVKKVGMITASHLISTQDSSDENSGIIVAITVASIVAVCLFVLGVGLLVMRHRQAQTKFAKRCTPVTLDDYSLDNISVYNSFRRKQRLRGSKRSYTNAAFDDPNAPSKPLNATQLAAVLTDVPALENEFRAIPNVTATLDDIPNGAETRNRYANVIPMPDSRVLLTFQEDTPNSDYINANYARGETGEQKRYIITQGPLEETIVDFWRMVWEQQIRVIYMLTDFAEGGITKCAEYYPRSETIDCSQLHGDFQITLEKRDISDHCITSYLVIKDMERNLRRDVVHFWYHSWPEKGVPASPKMTIDFLNRSRKFTKEQIPVLVHCSPGTGRSGAIVACDIAMKEYDATSKIDIPQIVMKLRQDRAGAVQTKEQYVHIYEVLHSYVSRLGGANLESI